MKEFKNKIDSVMDNGTNLTDEKELEKIIDGGIGTLKYFCINEYYSILICNYNIQMIEGMNMYKYKIDEVQKLLNHLKGEK